MKTVIYLLSVIAILLVPFSGNAAGEQFQLKLHAGQQISFDYTHQSEGEKVMVNRFGPDHEWLKTQWNMEVKVVQQNGTGLFILEVTPIRYIFHQHRTQNPDFYFDSMFHPAARDFEHPADDHFLFGILCGLQIPMQLEPDQNKLTFSGDQHLEQEIENRLLNDPVADHPEPGSLKRQIMAQTEKIRRIVEGYLLRFNQAVFTTKDSTRVRDQDYLVYRSGNQLRLTRQTTVQKGDSITKYSQEAVVDANSRLLTEYVSTTRYPPVRSGNHWKSHMESEETTYLLCRNSDTFTPETSISGYIEHPKGKHVQVQVLENPAGIDLKLYPAKLDQDNHFSIIIPLKKEGFVFLANAENDRMSRFSPGQVIYAEPGDRIDFDWLGEGDNRTIRQKGDRITENNSFFSHNPLVSVVLDHLMIGVSFPVLISTNPGIFRSLDDYTRFIRNDQLDKLWKNPDLSLRFKRYLSNEMRMLKLELAAGITDELQFWGKEDLTPKLRQVLSDMKLFVDSFNVMRYYNENGYLSRLAVSRYANSLFRQNRRYAVPASTVHFSGIFGYFYGQQETYDHYLDLLLAGPALIREKAGTLDQNLDYSQQFNSHDPETWYALQARLGRELIKWSRDSALNSFLKTRLQHAREFLDGDTYQRRLFLDQQGDTVSVADFLGQKPVVLYVSPDWAASRYFMDDLSKKYPEADFIFLVEGDNFQQWKDYLKRAESKAIQLFLPKGGSSLQELFSVPRISNRIIVFDINGKVIEYEADLDHVERYLKAAQNPPEEKKELNKSTLLWIIGLLGGLILAFLIVSFIFRYRTRIKMKKQDQEKRLRELQLSAIRAQMNPHFLFNSLNSVQNLIQKNQGQEAHLYLSNLAGLIRRILKNSQREEISLAGELETLNQYIRLEQLRFDFEFIQTIDEQIDQNHFMVPSMILQPIAENAIIHGLQHKKGDKRLKVEVIKKEHGIQINLEDNGIGMQASQKIRSVSNGVGLSLNEERLKLMQEKYGGNYLFRIINLAEPGQEGTRVEIEIPEEE